MLSVPIHSAEDLRDRGLLYVALDCYGLAARDLETYLGMAPGASDGPVVRATLERMRHKQTRVN